MPKLFQPLAALCLVMGGLFIGPAQAQGDVEISRIAKMELKELAEFVATITGSVGQDTLKLQPAAQRGDCLELTRAANSFALGYSMLAEAQKSLEGKPPKEVLQLKAHIVQSRVLTFAARVRADEWVSWLCASFVPPADKLDEPRYAKPARLLTAEYTQAVIEARLAADANLANAIAAGIGRKCPQVVSAMQSIQLFVPYLDKLAKDIQKRPEALGPRASRRALEVARAQLIAAGNKLYREVGIGCRAPAPVAEEPPVEPAPTPATEAPTPAAP